MMAPYLSKSNLKTQSFQALKANANSLILFANDQNLRIY